MREVPFWIDALAAVLVVVGVAFALVGSLGLVKLSDFLKRLHGPTKASTLGVGCVLIASMLYFAGTGRPAFHELLITLFVFLTAPVSAHLLVKAAMRLDPRLGPSDPPGQAGSTTGEPDGKAPR
ncbi:MAG: Na+/H+ antiporter subunit G [Burkholderiaceae bacterium]